MRQVGITLRSDVLAAVDLNLRRGKEKSGWGRLDQIASYVARRLGHQHVMVRRSSVPICRSNLEDQRSETFGHPRVDACGHTNLRSHLLSGSHSATSRQIEFADSRHHRGRRAGVRLPKQWPAGYAASLEKRPPTFQRRSDVTALRYSSP